MPQNTSRPSDAPVAVGRPTGRPAQPLYEHVYSELTNRIGTEWRPGSRIPSERALRESLGVSRVTLRRALALLEADGLLDRPSGRGWHIAGSDREDANELLSFSEIAFGRGLTPSAVVLRADVRDATLDEADTLGIAPGAQLFDLERLRLMDGVAVAIDGAQLSLAKAPFLRDVDFTTASLHQTLEEHGIWPSSADYRVDVVDADTRVAALLDVPEGKGLLCVSGVTFDQGRLPLEIGSIAYRPDRYRLKHRVVRRVAGRPPA